jgi:hypothetical protein
MQFLRYELVYTYIKYPLYSHIHTKYAHIALKFANSSSDKQSDCYMQKHDFTWSDKLFHNPTFMSPPPPTSGQPFNLSLVVDPLTTARFQLSHQ